MIYSVWDHAERRYDYYRTPEKSNAVNAPKPKHVPHKTLGATPEEAAWPLPKNARPVGSGKYPKGMIAARKNGLSGLGFFDITDLLADPTKLILAGVAGYFAWQYLRRR